MRRFLAIAPVAALLLSMSCQHVTPSKPLQLEATALPDVDPIGFAAPFAGESNGVLIVAGGTNFPGDPPWKKGTKVWHDDILAYEGSAWRKVGKLSPAIAGGASVSTKDGIICIGGGDAKNVVADVFRLTYVNGTVLREDFSPLPKPTQACAAVQVGERIFAVGGHNQLSPLVPGPSSNVYSIDANALKSGWREETPIPAEPRWFPVVGTDGKSLFVISGFTGVKAADGKDQIHCLSDVWRYEPAADGKGKWTRLADLPRPNAASPSPAPYANGKLLLMGGGVEDATLKIPMQEQKGFPMTITAVDAKTGESQIIGEVRSSVVVGPVVPWKDGWIVVSGEIRSGVRTPSVWWYRVK